MIPDHTKFVPNLLFSKISTEDMILSYAKVIVDDGSIVSDWRNKLSKYSKFPGIHSLHNFLFVKRGYYLSSKRVNGWW